LGCHWLRAGSTACGGGGECGPASNATKNENKNEKENLKKKMNWMNYGTKRKEKWHNIK